MGLETLEKWIIVGKQRGASDLHLDAGCPPIYRVRGELVHQGDAVSAEALHGIAQALLKSSAWDAFVDRKSADLSKTISGVRCRINCFVSLKGISLSVRLLTSFKNTLRDANLHPDLKKLLGHETGLIIVSGPTGSGKTTTLAALIEEVNMGTRAHIISVESPIEYFFKNRNSIIRQREIPTHAPTFERAIEDSLREDPDILVIGEMRSAEVMRQTLNAAETGHLVLATMHSSSCAETISRLCMSFPAEIQPAVQAQVADGLIAVINQRLAYLPDEKILVPVLEIMKTNGSVRANIRAGTVSQLVSCIQTGAEDGMYTFERYRKWVDQKRDWVMPQQATRMEADDPDTEKTGLNLIKRPSTRSAPANDARRMAAKTGPGDRLEITADEIDLAELAKDLE